MEPSNPPNPSEISMPRIAENLQKVNDNIASACLRSGRNPSEVTLVAVTKTVSKEICQTLYDLGCRNLAENRPQTLWEKTSQIPSDPSDPIRWHFIGHLQRNKSARTLPLLHTLHSLDSLRLAEQLTKDLATQPSRHEKLQVCLELNITNDSTKTGLTPQDAQTILHRYASEPHWQQLWNLSGLMGMSSLQATPSQMHAEFALLRSLRDQWQQEYGLKLPELSMGMSDDYAIAIEEGSTMVRIGSLLYR